MRYRLQRHDGTDCSATMVPITVLRMVPIQRYRHDIPIYLSKDTTLSTILKEENTPFIFVMDERLYMDDLFIPIKELPNYSDLYFHIMKTKYFRNL